VRKGSGQALKFFSRKNPRPWACQCVTSQVSRQACSLRERLSLLSSVPHEQCPAPRLEDAGLGAAILLGVGEGIVSQM